MTSLFCFRKCNEKSAKMDDAAKTINSPGDSVQISLEERLSALCDRELRYEDKLKNCRISPKESEITGQHRDIAAEWMHEVVLDSLRNSDSGESVPKPESQNADKSDKCGQHLDKVEDNFSERVDSADIRCGQMVFVLAVTLLDRFLDTCPILPNQLQLLASSCLLLSAKVRRKLENRLNEDSLIDYTDHSITKTELKVTIISR